MKLEYVNYTAMATTGFAKWIKQDKYLFACTAQSKKVFQASNNELINTIHYCPLNLIKVTQHNNISFFYAALKLMC